MDDIEKLKDEAENATLSLLDKEIEIYRKKMILTNNFPEDDPPHNTMKIRHPRGEFIDIDVSISRLIQLLWYTYNIQTTGSCENIYTLSTHKGIYTNIVWIEFETFGDMDKFIKKFISGSLNRYFLMIRTWEYNINVSNTNKDFKSQLLKYYFSVRFPVEQLDLVEFIFGADL